MRIFFGGTRGTNGTADRRFMHFGGDTTSVLVTGSKGDHVILDAGTGLRRVAEELRNNKTAGSLTLLMTHFHLDHIMGLPSFAPIYSAEAKLTVCAVRRGTAGVRDIMAHLMRQPIWPVELGELRSDLKFRELDGRSVGGPVRIGALCLRWCAVQHPGGCTAYRIEEQERAFVFATDIEWRLMTASQRRAFLKLCVEPRPAQVLAMDGQYTAHDYKAHQGWGHSTWEDVVEVAMSAGISRALVTHHSPHADDRELARREARLQRQMPAARFARDGMEVAL